MSNVTLTIAGTVHEGWTSAKVNLSMENLCGAFQLALTDKWGGQKAEPRQIKPGDSCTIDIDGETVITGYIDKVNPSYDANTHTINVQGRDKTGDLVDCSVINNKGQWKGLKLEQIVTRICDPFGIPVRTNVDTGSPIVTFNIEQGSSAFEAIQKLCKMRSCLAISDGKGGLLITRAGTERATTPLVEGQNILIGNAEYDFTDRFATYICKGQKQGDDSSTPDTNNHNQGVVTDEFVTRYRPLVVVANGQADTKSCKELARWEATVRRGKSRKFTITVAGWKQKDGTLWGINKLVSVTSPWLALTDTLIIAGVQFSLDESGELAELALTSAEAYAVIDDDAIKKKKGKKGSKSATDNAYIEG